MRDNKIKRAIWGACGLITFGLGAIGVVVPGLPTTPFLLLSAICFPHCSERINNWFIHTKLYERFIVNYTGKPKMTLKDKLRMLIPVTLLLGISFVVMGNIPVGRIVVSVIFVAHIIYFCFIVKTVPEEAKAEDGAPEGEAAAEGVEIAAE